jgi:hypothetical protein
MNELFTDVSRIILSTEDYEKRPLDFPYIPLLEIAYIHLLILQFN